MENSRIRGILTVLCFVGLEVSVSRAGFCNWGDDGTAATSTCSGGAQGGLWCNVNRNHCEDGCGGRWCTKPACGDGWMVASWTTYTSYAPCCQESPNYDPSADTTECTLYSACDYLGQFAYSEPKSFDFVKSNNIVAFFSRHGDNESFANKKIRISSGGKTVEAEVLDTCGDNDCDGCCTTNARPSGYLIDMEYWTVVNNFGSADAAVGQVCWQLVEPKRRKPFGTF